MQRWLSLSGICTTLGLNTTQINRLVKDGFLVTIKANKEVRYLDPTPEYAEKLKLGEVLYSKQNHFPRDFDLVTLLTLRELAEIVGWTFRYAEKYCIEHKVPAVKVGRYNLYSVATVRELLWRRSGRKLASQLAPFRIQALIDWFLKSTTEAEKLIPTDREFIEDMNIQKRLAKMGKLPSPARETMIADFFRKLELAKTVSGIVRASETSSASHHS